MPQTPHTDQQHRAILQSIAQRAMLERGLLPDFSAAVLAELDRMQAPTGVNGEQGAKSAAALLLEARIGEQFDAIVTGAAEKGTWASLLTMPVAGRVVHGFAGMDVADRIHVQLIAVDVERGYIDLSRAGSSRH